MIPNLPPITVTGDDPVAIVDPELILVPSSGSNSFGSTAGYSLLLVTDGSLYFGNAEMTRENTSLFPAGTWPWTLQDGEILYALSELTATEVEVKRVGQGFKGEGNSSGGGGFGEGGFG